MSTASDQAVRAYEFAHGEIWDAFRGLYDAFRVDTGIALDEPLPLWKDLTEEQRLAFIRAFRPLLGAITSVALAVA